jgi:hypothetical protein
MQFFTARQNPLRTLPFSADPQLCRDRGSSNSYSCIRSVGIQDVCEASLTWLHRRRQSFAKEQADLTRRVARRDSKDTGRLSKWNNEFPIMRSTRLVRIVRYLHQILVWIPDVDGSYWSHSSCPINYPLFNSDPVCLEMSEHVLDG